MSPGTGRLYPLTMICEVWRVGRSTVYAARDREESGGPAGLKKRGPKTKLSDEELVEEIRQVLKESDFLGEGHRKVRARLRAKGIGVGKNRVLRLMRENGLLAPVRRGKHPRGDRSHSGRITEADLRYMVVSPDGTLAAYRSNESGRNEIYVRSFPEPGGLTIVSEGGGSDAFWSPDGNTLYYARSPGVFTAARIERDPVPVVVSRDPLFTVTQRIIRPFQGSGLYPDGDRFILARDVGTTDAAGGAAVPQRLILIQNFFEELKERVPN